MHIRETPPHKTAAPCRLSVLPIPNPPPRADVPACLQSPCPCRAKQISPSAVHGTPRRSHQASESLSHLRPSLSCKNPAPSCHPTSRVWPSLPPTPALCTFPATHRSAPFHKCSSRRARGHRGPRYPPLETSPTSASPPPAPSTRPLLPPSCHAR